MQKTLLRAPIFLFVIFCCAMVRCFPSFIMKRHFFGRSVNMMVSSSKMFSSVPTTPMPITVLSGFLGAGKTSFLNHVLNNQVGLKFGLVVNDMATVNVDAKQIRQQNIGSSDGIDTMELQNGCVCCSIAEELIASVSKLVSISDTKGTKYDHIILECSGVAEPRKVRDLFQQAEAYDTQLMKKVRLDTMITVVDATVFFNLFGTQQLVSAHPDLAYNKDDLQMQANTQSRGEEGHRKVTELLLEQVECADIVLINKIDLLQKESDIELVRKVITSINPGAQIISCVRGAVPSPLTLPGSVGGKGAAERGILDEHRNMVKAAEKSVQLEQERVAEEQRLLVESQKKAHDHSHGHQHNDDKECKDTKCTNPAHNHDHSHKHSHGHSHDHHKVECQVSECTDPTHEHHHDEEHKHTHHSHVESCASTCTDPTHDHSHAGHSHHAQDHKVDEACEDKTCTDPTHDHSHGHSHSATATTAETRFGITSFVYKRRTPFHPMRFSAFLNAMGKLSVSGISEIEGTVSSVDDVSDSSLPTPLQVAQKSLLRSKGFVWMATSSQAAYFMSHAGQFLELIVLGRWWGDIPREDWPVEIVQDILSDYPQPDAKHSDRRQELVFIGQFGGAGSSSRIALEKALDDCLLTSNEMVEYDTITGETRTEGPGSEAVDDQLKTHFVRNGNKRA